LIITNSWKAIIGRLKDMKLVLLKGKAGRGKSMLLTYIMFRIIYLAITNKIDPLFPNCPTANNCDANTPLLYFKDPYGCGHVVTMSGVSVINNDAPPDVYYSFADNVDSGCIGRLLTMAVTSGELSEFPKKVSQARAGGITLFLPSLRLDDMKLLFGDTEETEFKFKVVGGHPRKYFNNQRSTVENEYYLVQKIVQKYFGEDYIADSSTPLSAMSEKQKLGTYAIDIVTLELKGMGNKTDSSFFNENFIDETVADPYNTDSEQCSSRFLEVVVGAVCNERQGNLDTTLRKLFGSGVRNSFEHEALYQLVNSQLLLYCRSQDGSSKCFDLREKSIATFRNVDDVKSIANKIDTCCIPDICNFPILDAIVPKEVGLQFTIASTHEVSNTKLRSILSQLDIRAADFSIIFVVPGNIVSSFKFPTNLGKCKLYVTSPDCNTDAVLKQKFKSKKPSAEEADI
jgi:hypothetical protein